MVCLQRFFVFVLFSFSKLYSFKLERIQHNINILSRLELYYYLRCFFLFMFFVLFLFGSWGGVGGVH